MSVNVIQYKLVNKVYIFKCSAE